MAAYVMAAGDDMFGQLPGPHVDAGAWMGMAVGEISTVGVAADGTVYEWGGEDGGGGVCSRMAALDTLDVVKVSLGADHAIALESTGCAVVWGRNEYGQLGLGKDSVGAVTRKPKRVRSSEIVDVCAAANASFLLTDSGAVFAAGDNAKGQLGLDIEDACVPSFVPVAVPVGVPIVRLAAGESHLLLLDADGGVWACGSNRTGELGLSSAHLDRLYRVPTLLTLLNEPIVGVAAAGRASAALAASGTLYTWGDGSAGVLGRGSLDSVAVPHRVAPPATAPYTSMALGPTALFARDATGIVWSCGSARAGQLLREPVDGAGDEGAPGRALVLSPIPGSEHWPVSGAALGADVTILALDETTGPRNSLEFANHSRVALRLLSWDELSSLSTLAPCGSGTCESEFLSGLTGAFSSPSTLNMSFVSRESRTLDLELASTFFEHIHGAPPSGSKVPKALRLLVLRMCRKLRAPRPSSPYYALRYLHLLALALDDHAILGEPTLYVEPLSRYFEVVSGLGTALMASFTETLVLYPTRAFARLLKITLAILDAILAPHTQPPPSGAAAGSSTKLPRAVFVVLAMVRVLWQTNKARSKDPESGTGRLPVVAFAASSLAPSRAALSLIASHAAAYASAARSHSRLGESTFNVVKTPYIIPLDSKSALLRHELTLMQNRAVQQAAFVALTSGVTLVSPPALHLPLRRSDMAGDLVSLLVDMGEEIDADPGLPLRIQFVDEDGIDDGGLSRELFSSVAPTIFSPGEFGMFDVRDKGHVVIDPLSTASPAQFAACGRVMGLAVFAGAQLGVSFPEYFFRMLLASVRGDPSPSRSFHLDELAELDADLARGLQCLLDFEGDDIETTFMATFCIELESRLGRKSWDLLPNGGTIPVTAENRVTYVSEYVYALLDASVRPAFDAFAAGFTATSKLDRTTALHAINPAELGELLAGSGVLDMDALRSATRYSGGYTDDSPPVVAFWEYVAGLSPRRQKQLLKFVTGTDVPPPGGLGHARFVIERAGGGTSRLPSAHTCYSYLLLPPYESLEELSAAFDLALDASPGFGLR